MDGIDYTELLQDNISLDEAEKLQIKYRKFLKEEERKSKVIESPREISILAGVDVSYYLKDDLEYGVSCAVFWNLEENKIIETSIAHAKVNFPYKAGYLGFRESRLISLAIKNAHLKPELIICDGHGINHPRRFGEAVQIGLVLQIPSIGIAKNPFFGYSDWKSIKKEKGLKEPIWKFKPNRRVENNEILGYSICLVNRTKPVFISIGYRITLETALNIALRISIKNRQTEPLFLADKFSRVKVKEYNI